MRTAGARARWGELHGLSKSPEHKIWHGIKERCCNPASKGYKNYGGRGISICDRWRDKFSSFYADIGPRPSALYSIERIDNNGNYEPGNCRWATMKEQGQNRRTNRNLSYKGKTQAMTAWAEDIGVSKGVLWRRLQRGISVEIALTMTPHAITMLTVNGVTKPLREWALIAQIPFVTAHRLFRAGKLSNLRQRILANHAETRHRL